MRHHAIAIVFLLAVPVAGALGASHALAADDDRAAALDLFAQGRELVRAGEYQAALSKFAAAAKIMRTFGILLNIAECEEKLGRTASAWATWAEARSVAVEGHRADDEAMALERQRALEPSLSRLTIVVPTAADLPDLEIRRDGEVVARAAWGTAIAVDPGAHVVEAKAVGRETKTFDIMVPPKAGRATLTIIPLGEAPTPASSQPPPAAPAPAPQPAAAIPLASHDATGVERALYKPAPVHESSGPQTAGWILGGIGVAAAGAGIGVALAGQGKHNNALALSVNNYDDQLNYKAALSEESTANTMKTAGFVSIAGGAAALATGIVLLLAVHPSSGAAESSSARTTRPRIYPSGDGLTAVW